MYDKITISPQDLTLDPSNPRFIIPNTGGSQDDIRKYLIAHEDVLFLARSISEYNGLMPGERIVVCPEDNKYVVLEGNRRTCACQMFLDRSLIPSDYLDRFPASNNILLDNIRNIEVDVIKSRIEAKRFLAVRHIERAREWSTIAKMRFCYEDYTDGNRTIQEINERTGIQSADIKKLIRNYKILLRGITSIWPEQELNQHLLELEPAKLLRLFELKDTRRVLKLYYDNGLNLHSHLIRDADLEEIIAIWAKKAFIENKIDTRSEFGTYKHDGESTEACKYIVHILNNYYNHDGVYGNENTTSKENDTQEEEDSKQEDKEKSDSGQTTNKSGQYENTENKSEKTQQNQGGGPDNLPFFSTLCWDKVNPGIEANKGIIAICKELKKISNSTTFINNYPICTAFIIRALIEHSLRYYARTKGYWGIIMQAYNTKGQPSREPNLGFIIKQFEINLTQWIPEQSIYRLFQRVFSFKRQEEVLNLVVHYPEKSILSADSLKAIPQEGLLSIVNYLLQ